MANPYFSFKQFTVFHDKCAMKVGTDGVLLGAWAKTDTAKTILDIGTGSGLIALMLAQRNQDARITAIDIDKNAVEQAKENFLQSPFNNRIECYFSSLQELAESSLLRYDTIISNPPFFKHSLKSLSESRTLARHTDSLTADELIKLSSRLLSSKGVLSVIYPYEYKQSLLSLATTHNLYASRITNVYPTPQSSPKRILLELNKENIPLIEDDLIIEQLRHTYSDEFTSLVKDFYLNL